MLTVTDVARYPRPGMGGPGLLRFTPDSSRLTFLLSGEGDLVRSLWSYEIGSGERHVLAGRAGEGEELSREEELRRERTRTRELGVTDYIFARDAETPTLLIPGGRLLRVAAGDEPLRELAGSVGPLEEPRLSPNGRFVSFVRAGELHVLPIEGGEARQLSGGAEDGLTNGLADFIAQEEFDQPAGHWWSPDSGQLAYVRADSRHIPPYPIVHQGAREILTERHRYPFAGSPNARVTLGVIDVGGGATRWMDLEKEEDFYLVRVAWQPDGALTAQVLSRDQKTLRLLRFDAGGAVSLLLEERSTPWINITHDARFLESGEWLWSSERSGFRHLYLYAADGSPIRRLTEGDWMVTDVVGVDEARRLVYFSATAESVLERQIYRTSLDGGGLERLSQEPGWHRGVLSNDGDWLVDSYSSLEQPRVVTLLATDGSTSLTLHEESETGAAALGLRPPELLTMPGADGSALDGALYRPDPPVAPAPLIVAVYGGPHAQLVANDWSMTVDVRAQYLAQQGFLVLRLDNRGAAGRGLAFEAALHERLGRVEVEDQIAGVRFLVEQGWADPERVGIYGWSYGGYMTALCMMRAPDVFKAGVAGAPVADWDGYDTGYTERYMGTPAGNAEGYREASLLTHADELEGHLLLVHGGVDENVHFRHTARLITALTKAQKPYDLLIFPEERHMPRDAAGLEYMERRLVAYFEAHL